MTSEWPWTFNGGIYPVYTKYYPPPPQGSNVGSFCPMTSHFRDTMLPKIEHRMTSNWIWTPTCNSQKYPELTLEHLTAKRTLHTLNTCPWVQIFVSVALRPAAFEIQGCWKLQYCTEWPKNAHEHLTDKLRYLNAYRRAPNLYPFRYTSHFPAKYPEYAEWPQNK